jgi:20S proteasome subunit alpha 7
MQGYFGAAAGKGKQVAKNELEKLDLKNMTCREAVYKAAKMYLDVEIGLS